MKRRNRRDDGFTLGEILVAVGLFAIAITGLVSLFPATQRVAREGEEEARAAIIADNILESLPLVTSPGNFSLPVGMKDGAVLLEPLAPSLETAHSVAFGPACEPLCPVPGEKADSPSDNPEALDIATLRLLRSGSNPGMVKAEVTVSSPASAPLSRRRSSTFVRLLPLPVHD
jgi:hypothetical protein